MDFALSEEQAELAGLTRTILADLVTHERLQQLEAQGPSLFDRELWAQLAEAGVLAAVVPEAHGGSGLGFGALLGVLEEAGQALAPVPLVPTLVMGALPLAQFGSEELQAALLPGVADGSIVLTAALEEPGHDDPAAPTTRARADGDGWRLTGEKQTVPYAQHAERVLVAATTEDGEVLVGLLDPRAPGVELTEHTTTNRQPVADLALHDAPLAAAEVLAAPGAGAAVVTWTVERAAAAVCALQAGVCERALRMTAEHTGKREQFGKPIAEFQAVAQRAADAYVDTEMIRLTARQAFFRLDAGWPATNEVHVAKFWAGEGGMRVVHSAQHLHGGIGVDTDYPLHRYFLWAKQNEHTLGTPTRELIRLGAALADEPV